MHPDTTDPLPHDDQTDASRPTGMSVETFLATLYGDNRSHVAPTSGDPAYALRKADAARRLGTERDRYSY